MYQVTNFSLQSLEDRKAVFTVRGDLDSAKDLHDSFYQNVPTVCIDLVLIATNDSVAAVNDEVLAARLGQLTIKSDNSELPLLGLCERENRMIVSNDKVIQEPIQKKPCGIYNLAKDSDENPLCCVEDKQCEPCAIYFDLDVTNDTQETIAVTHLDLKGEYTDLLYYNEEEPVILTYLPAKGSIQLRALAVKSTGKVHTKFIPVVSVTYEAMDEANILGERTWKFSIETNDRLTAENTIFAAI